MTQPREAPVVEDLRKRFANPEVPEDIPVNAREHDAVSIVMDVNPVVSAKAVHGQGTCLRHRTRSFGATRTRTSSNTVIPAEAGMKVRTAQPGTPPAVIPSEAGMTIPPPASWPRWLRPALLLLALLSYGTAAVHAEPERKVEAVQRALAERGYDPGTIDGAMGQRTAGALREFQRSFGLPDTGEIDDATWAVLGLESATGAERSPEQDTGAEAKETDVLLTEARPATLQAADANRIDTATVPGEDTTPAESSRAEPALAVRERPRLGYSTLGWHPPQTGSEALARFDEIGAPPQLRRGKGTLFVPKGELVFVLERGERFPGLECDPGAGRLSIEFVFGPDGPVIFTPIGDGEFCQAGIGIVIGVGRTLAIRRIDWGDLQRPQGTVRVTGRGLEYVD